MLMLHKVNVMLLIRCTQIEHIKTVKDSHFLCSYNGLCKCFFPVYIG